MKEEQVQGRSNALWYAVIGALVVVLVGVIAFVAWPRDDEPAPAPDPTVAPSATAAPTTPDPGPDQSPTTGSTLDPADFGGHPPAQLLDPLLEPWPEEIPLPPQLGEYRIDPELEIISPSSSQGDYLGPDGRRLRLVVDPGYLSYPARMESMEGHHQVGYMVCGDWQGYPQCAAAAEDADLVVGTPPGTSEAVTEDELVEAMDAVVDWYRSQA